jgi:hypothetical protein
LAASSLAGDASDPGHRPGGERAADLVPEIVVPGPRRALVHDEDRIALGAILKWAITAHVEGVNLQNMGVILIVVGGAGLALGLFLLMSARSRGIPPPPEI